MKNLINLQKKSTENNGYDLEAMVVQKIMDARKQILDRVQSYKGDRIQTPDLEGIRETIEAKFNPIISFIQGRCNTKYYRGKVNSEAKHKEELQQGIEAQLKEAHKKRKVAEHEKGKIKTSYDWSNYTWYRIALFFTYFSESIFFGYCTYNVFKEIPALLFFTALSFSVSLYYCNRFVMKQIRRAVNKRRAIITYGISYILIFYSLSVLRAKAMGLSNIYFSIEHIALVGISLMLVVASMYLSTLLPSSSEKKRKQLLNKNEAELKEQDQKINNLEQEKASLPHRVKEEIHRAWNIIAMEETLIDLVEKSKEECFHDFIAELRVYADNTEPEIILK